MSNIINAYVKFGALITNYDKKALECDYLESRTPPEVVEYNEKDTLARLQLGQPLDWNAFRISIGDNSRITKTKKYNPNSIADAVSNLLSDRKIEQPAQPAQPAQPEQHSLFDENTFWSTVAKLRWTDLDDGVKSSKYSISTWLTATQTSYIKTHIYNYIGDLDDIFTDFDWFSEMDHVEINNFLYHIICKGKDFYNSVLETPELALYLLDDKQYQPLYTYLNQL